MKFVRRTTLTIVNKKEHFQVKHYEGVTKREKKKTKISSISLRTFFLNVSTLFSFTTSVDRKLFDFILPYVRLNFNFAFSPRCFASICRGVEFSAVPANKIFLFFFFLPRLCFLTFFRLGDSY